ncbi:hypothetical protein LSO07_17320 [Janthinobacterium sp. PLB04]|uniref:Lactate dehydrogenase n=1 Tax=Janthinobacterium lividum TaxID=29581 RepID=A0AAJ4T3J1_9BURK|nr:MULTISPECIES: hypothetical protein [Janthinobacterium]KAB0325394.1 hypothetical protein F3B38_17205 [Janthinobacterium lividum]QSX94490.1 hypothetical protein J3P46_17305 [Janthinobacterium lividum]UGQ34277.1 hypothetical protein LSO07_17320 [Janthinobacterium sp. PLB04]
MTSISPLSSWNSAPSRASAATPNRTEAPAPSASTPSSIVALSPESVNGSNPAALVKPPMVWESATRDKVSDAMTKSFSSYAFGGRFSGLGAAMLGQAKLGNYNFSQAMRQPPPSTTPNVYGASAIAPGDLHGNGEDRVALSITTKSGVEVKLSLDSQGDGLAVNMTASGELSDAEASALGELAKGFQEAIDGMGEGTPKLKLAGLMQFDQQVLESVKLHAEVKVRGEPESAQTLDFQADGAQRKVSFSGVAGSLDLKVDASQLNTLGSRERQAKAVDSYMKQFDQAASRGHGDAGLVAMLKDGFTALHGNTSAPQAATDTPETGKWRLAAEDKSILTGLADFSASVSQAVNFSNPMRSMEKDGFNYEVSQKTLQAGASQDERSVRQQQQSKLSASFHQSLVPGVPLRLTTSTESQNYTYHQIEDTASSDAQVAYKDGKMVKASLRQEGSQSERVMKYFLGKLESDKTTPGNYSVLRDLLPVLGPYRSGEKEMTPEARLEQRKQALLTLSDDVLLQSYAGRTISLWQADVLPAEADKTAGAV